ncbi:MAG: hypothetical protein NT151_09515 [Acidobacteria bacterium]|nr:hypothetical protein [Acidobacteriota bacterium]
MMPQQPDWFASNAPKPGALIAPPVAAPSGGDNWFASNAPTDRVNVGESAHFSVNGQPVDHGVIVDALLGALKGLGTSAVGLGKLATKIPGVAAAIDAGYGALGVPGINTKQALEDVGPDLAPQNTAQKVGNVIEQVAEYFVPGAQAEKLATGIAAKVLPAVTSRLGRSAINLGTRSAVQSGLSAGMTKIQGGDVGTAAGVGAAMPVIGGAVAKAAEGIGSLAVPLVRAAIKPTVTAMKQQAGASVQGIDAIANRLSRFILDNKLTTPAKAEALITAAEKGIQDALSKSSAVSDAPQRAMRYLQALERSAAKQGLPADDVATIRRAASELLEQSPLSETVTKTVMRPSIAGLFNASGQPALTPQQVASRALRTDVAPGEALDIARGTSRWSNRKAWGEMKGAGQEASKAVERAARDSVKAAVPETQPLFAQQKAAIQAKQTLDRTLFRQGNRDAVSLPAHVIAAGEIASGKLPLLSFAANWLRNNQMRAGVWAKRLEDAITNQNAQEAGEILGRFGVVVSSKQ